MYEQGSVCSFSRKKDDDIVKTVDDEGPRTQIERVFLSISALLCAFSKKSMQTNIGTGEMAL